MNDAHSQYPLEEHQRFAVETRRGAVAVMNIVERWVDIGTVLDLGCGTGIWLRVMRDGGRRQVFGVDFEATDPADLEVDPDLVLTADLGQRLDLHQRYDLVMCLEAAEHIDAQFADVVVDNCVRHADLILFSAALPGQQGVHHVNEQPPQYWAERFQRHDYTVLDLIRPLIWDDRDIPVWYRQNMLLFVKNGSAQQEALRAWAGMVSSGPLAVAHPEYMRWFSAQAQAATAEAERATAEAARRYTELVQLQAELVQLQAELAQVRQNLAAEKLARETAQRTHDRVSAELTIARGEIARLQWELGVIRGSTLWRAMEPLRRMGRAIPPSRQRQIRRMVRGVIPSLRRSNVSENHAADQAASGKVADSAFNTPACTTVVRVGSACVTSAFIARRSGIRFVADVGFDSACRRLVHAPHRVRFGRSAHAGSCLSGHASGRSGRTPGYCGIVDDDRTGLGPRRGNQLRGHRDHLACRELRHGGRGLQPGACRAGQGPVRH